MVKGYLSIPIPIPSPTPIRKEGDINMQSERKRKRYVCRYESFTGLFSKMPSLLRPLSFFILIIFTLSVLFTNSSAQTEFTTPVPLNNYAGEDSAADGAADVCFWSHGGRSGAAV